MRRTEPSIDFTTEEVLTACDVAGLPRPVGLVDAMSDVPEEVQAYLRTSARESLTVRGVLAGSDGEQPVIAEAVATLLEVAGAPGLLCIVAVEQEGIVETRFFAASPDLGVEHLALATTLHRFVIFPTRDLLARVLRFVDLRPADAPDALSFVVPVSVLERVGEAAEAYEDERAGQLLAEAGASPTDAVTFIEALRAKRSTINVTILHKPTEQTVEGGALTWLDAGMNGLWISEPADDDATVEIKPVDAKTISGELLSYLPGAFALKPLGD
jgi:hypothetical protein